ncbi:MAG: cyclic nucleotide-binding domain-containing protein [Leptospiraceae bacterium]|nr:cyclic nucleotide-binding domain-containing protein [Leptospiraceae bacterium]
MFIIFYLIYYGNIKPILEFIQSFLMGVLGGLFILLLAPLIVPLLDTNIDFFDIFLKAALIEKFVSFLMIYFLVFSFNREADLNKILIAGVQYAAGFAFLENVIYQLQFDSRMIYLRLISSVPMHLSTCGIQAYFIGLSIFYSLRKFRFLNAFLGLLIPVFLHSVYDYLTLSSENTQSLIGPSIVLSIFIFEVLYSKIQTYPKKEQLQKEDLSLEDWITLQVQKGHLKWILYSSGTRNLPKISFFRFDKDYVKLTIAILMLIFPLIYLTEPEIYYRIFKTPSQLQFTLFFIMPISFFFIFLILGSVNPEYFKNKKIRIPVVLDVDILLKNKNTTTGISYELKPYSTFIHLEEELKHGEEIILIFSYKKNTSYPIKAIVKKYIPNFHKEYPSGIIVSLAEMREDFGQFYYNYLLYRIVKGFVFLLNLPGSERIRSLFVRPLTVMQNERFYKKGEVIFREGDTGKHFYLIKKGRVAFYKESDDNKRHKISELGVGDIFGEMALVSDKPRSATAECVEDTILAVAHKDHLEALLQANPEFVMKVIQNLIQIIHKKEALLEEYRKYNELYIKTLEEVQGKGKKKD